MPRLTAESHFADCDISVRLHNALKIYLLNNFSPQEQNIKSILKVKPNDFSLQRNVGKGVLKEFTELQDKLAIILAENKLNEIQEGSIDALVLVLKDINRKLDLICAEKFKIEISKV